MQFTNDDRLRFKELKHEVQSGEATTRAWGMALIEIDKHEYWRMDAAESMTEWCLGNSPLAYRTIESAMRRLQRVENERLIAQTTGETIIRENNTPRPQQSVDTRVIDISCVNKTASSQPQKPAKPEDEMGTIIPKPILAIWDRRGELQELAARISQVKCLIENKRNQEDPLFMKIDQSVVHRLEMIHHAVTNAIPYCVCGECEGRLEVRNGVCGACKSTGFMSKEDYRKLVPEEKQRLRIKGIELRKGNK